MSWKDLLAGLLRCWVALGGIYVREGEMEVAGVGLSFLSS